MVDQKHGEGRRRAVRPRRRIAIWGVLVPAALVVAYFGGLRVFGWITAPELGPLVGISVDTAWHGRIGLSHTTYEVALARVNVRVQSFLPGDGTPEELLDEIDALVLAGGGDVDPRTYGGDPKTAKLVDRERDDFERALIEGALARDMPILGVCRGLQILNVAHGGTLRSLRSVPELRVAHGATLLDRHEHEVEIKPGSRLAELKGAGTQKVNSFHGQAIDRLGRDLQAIAISPDGVIEAIERHDRSFVLATQWHPELLSLEDTEVLAIFAALGREATAYRGRRATP